MFRGVLDSFWRLSPADEFSKLLRVPELSQDDSSKKGYLVGSIVALLIEAVNGPSQSLASSAEEIIRGLATAAPAIGAALTQLLHSARMSAEVAQVRTLAIRQAEIVRDQLPVLANQRNWTMTRLEPNSESIVVLDASTIDDYENW